MDEIAKVRRGVRGRLHHLLRGACSWPAAQDKHDQLVSNVGTTDARVAL